VQKNKEALIQHIIEVSGNIYSALRPNVPMEYLSSDLTVAQLRVLLVLHADGPTKMSSIASILHVAFSTATSVMGNLVRKELVVRDVDPQDRRLVICKLSQAGQDLINKLWVSGEFQMERLLDGLTLEQLGKAAEVAEMLFDNISRKTSN
jgi:DNA-binding MarR family transcriptional regulator